jgi:hypothetical protein
MRENQERKIRAGQKSTGPRTEGGRRRTRYNALRSGLFAKTTVLKRESATEYEVLRKGIWEEFQPESALEVDDVEYLVTLLWRRRRVPVAESAEIAKLVECESFNSLLAQQLEAQDYLRAGPSAGGLLRHTSNPFVLEQAIELMVMCRDALDKYGFEVDDTERLANLYGLDHNSGTPFGVFFYYVLQLRRARGINKGFQNNYDKLKKTPEELKKATLVVFDMEIERLKRLEAAESIVSDRAQEYQAIAASVPPQDVLNRIYRAEAHLSREIDRVLNRLERARRRRQGQPEPPTLRVEVNKD